MADRHAAATVSAPGLDALLRALASRPDDAVWEELVISLRPFVAAVVRRVLGAGAEIDDLVQETFWRIHRRVGLYRSQDADPDRAAKAWVAQVARHCAVNWSRGQARHRQPGRRDAAVLADAVGAAADQDAGLDADAVREAVAMLDQDQRWALEQRFQQGRSYADIGRALGVSDVTARQRVERVLQHLRQRLAGPGLRVAMPLLILVLTKPSLWAAGAGAAGAGTGTWWSAKGLALAGSGAVATTLVAMGLLLGDSGTPPAPSTWVPQEGLVLHVSAEAVAGELVWGASVGVCKNLAGPGDAIQLDAARRPSLDQDPGSGGAVLVFAADDELRLSLPARALDRAGTWIAVAAADAGGGMVWGAAASVRWELPAPGGMPRLVASETPIATRMQEPMPEQQLGWYALRRDRDRGVQQAETSAQVEAMRIDPVSSAPPVTEHRLGCSPIRLAELLIYDRALSDAELAMLRRRLFARHHLAP